MENPEQSRDKQSEIPKELREVSALINNGKYQDALRRLTDYENNNLASGNLQLSKPSLLVDIGLGLKNPGLIQSAIDQNENNLLGPLGQKHNTIIHYNLANAYLSLFDLTERSKDNVATILQSENLQKAKGHFRQALLATDYPNRNSRIQILVNYGNCLDTLGRGVEALYAYNSALRIDKTFSMAIGNKAKALSRFADISGKYREAVHVEAYQAINSIINNRDLIDFGGMAAKYAFERELKYIESRFKDKADLHRQLNHPPYDTTDLSKFVRFYLQYCSKEKLFLNFHIHDDQCEAALVDPIFIRALMGVGDKDPFAAFYKYAKYINQIKEDYAVARLLLVQAQYKREDFDRISQRTTFVYCLDYSQFTLYIGLLKSAFKDAYNILDKIAVFINDYHGLGLDEEKIGFVSTRDARSVWLRAGNIRKEILASKNISLYALYDIFQDFKFGHYDKIKDIRHALTHRKLVIFDSVIADHDDKENKQNIGYDSMLEITADLLRMVKSAIIYLINFVNSEEDKKRNVGNGEFSIPLDTTQFL